MMIWLWCLLWGHKTVVKATVGQTFQTVNQLTGLPQTGHYYVFERKGFCICCGKNVHRADDKGITK